MQYRLILYEQEYTCCNIQKSFFQMRPLDQLFAQMSNKVVQKKVANTKRTIPQPKKPLPQWKLMKNGEPYPKPKLYKKQPWMTTKFYKHLERILKPQ